MDLLMDVYDTTGNKVWSKKKKKSILNLIQPLPLTTTL